MILQITTTLISAGCISKKLVHPQDRGSHTIKKQNNSTKNNHKKIDKQKGSCPRCLPHNAWYEE